MKKKPFAFSVSIFLSILLFAVCVSSCSRSNQVRSFSEESLFSLSYGNFEEQISLFGENSVLANSTYISMRDGFFYIVNGESQKIMSLNSYGDLLAIYYNADEYADKNPGLLKQSNNGLWKAVEYPFTYTGKMTVDSRKYMYVVATVPKERTEQAEGENLVYSYVVLSFSSDGSSIGYIGQQGFGGTPFPYIKDVYTTENDDLVVVCVTLEGLYVYWFSKDGQLRYRIPILMQKIPRISLDRINVNSALSSSDLYVTVENAVPDCYAEKLYVKVDYYLPYIDKDSRVESGIDYIQSCIYPLEIENGVYGEGVNILPYEESVTEDFSKITYRLPYDFLGVTRNGYFFFIIATANNGFSIEIMQDGTQAVLKRNLDLSHKEMLYYSLSLSHDGIISALIAQKDTAEVVWWRTDTLLDSVLHF
ncbi:MAG: hypothetical protein HDR51_05675 [Treponema sp.]|nr:hypothetical protein [Treponema sp.]MBD5412219.1 hypothetical protein [Treponema sp.]MBD5441880.1 hypothetical protein [Treponema sp.]MDE6244481.1 hypothetical protein [Treponemataceae bacterium]